MASEIKLPQLGENLTGGEVLDVRVKPGDTVSQGQTLLEVEAEKSTVEVPSPSAGRITKMLVNKGDAIQVGQTLCLIEATDGAKEEGFKEGPEREAAGVETQPEPRQATKPKKEPSKPEKIKQQEAKSSPADGAAKQATAPAETAGRPEEAEKSAAAERPAAAKSTPDGRQSLVP